MHILFATPAFPPFNGGGERYAGALAQQLVQRGHQVTVATSMAATEPELWLGCAERIEWDEPQPGLTVLRFPVRPIPRERIGLLAWRKGMVLVSALPGSTAVLGQMSRFIPPIRFDYNALGALEQPVDLVHGFNISWERAAMWGYAFARDRGLPFVMSPFAHLGTGPRDRVAFNSTMRHQLHLLDGADAVLTLTDVEAQGLRERGIVSPPLVTVGSGLDPLPMPVDLADPPAEPYVLFIGRASQDKGAMHAAEAVIKLREQGRDVRLLMIGRETETFDWFLQDLSAAGREAITLLGPVDDAVKHAYLEQATALLLPSHSDSFGIVLLEAWAHGVPVVAARAGGIPGVVDDGRNGLLVPFGDVDGLAAAVGRLLDDTALRKELGQDGRRKLQELYRWEAVATTVLDVYEDVLRARRQPETGTVA